MYQVPQTTRELLQRNVKDFSDREAFVSKLYRTGDWVRHTWKELDEISDRVAAGLAGLGLKQGMKTAFLLTNSAECYYTYLAIHKLGAVFVPINVRLVAREVEYIVENSEADFVIAGHDFLPLAANLKNRLGANAFVGVEKLGESLPDGVASYSALLECNTAPPAVEIGPEDVADILYTSGTTGLPKGVVLTQSNKVACGRLIGNSFDFARLHYGSPKIQTAFPFFTSSGCSSAVMMWLFYGLNLVLEDVFDVAQTLETFAKERPDVYGGAPTMFVFILGHPDFAKYDSSSIKKIISGAAAMPEEILRKLQGAWGDVKIYNMYALTEGGTGGTTLFAADATRKLGSIGQPWAPDQELRIVDLEGKDVKPGEVGEIALHGPNIMKEYYNNPKATAETLRDGWLHTGDIGYVDAEGYLYYTDRVKDMIVRGGYNVYSVEIESVLYEHPAIQQCAVVGKFHASLGEDIVAFVVLKPSASATAEMIREFVQDNLADYKRPRDIRIVEALPINPTGKINKKLMREQCAKEV